MPSGHQHKDAMSKPIVIKITKHINVYNLPKKIKETIKKELIVLNPTYLENKKMGRDNYGVDRLLLFYTEHKKHLSVPVGFVSSLFEFLNNKKLKFDVVEATIEFPAFFKFKGKLRDYQSTACEDVLKYDSGTLVAATGAGKTTMGIRLIAARQQKTLIIVHTKELQQQWKDRLCSFLDVTPHEIGHIGGGKFRIGRRVTVAMVQTVCKKVDELRSVFGHIIVDECHRVPSRTFTDALSGLKAKYKLGLTATAFRRDNLDKLIFWFVGPVRHEVSKKYLADEGHILIPRVIMKKTDFETELNPTSQYSKMLSELTADEKRNNMICDDIAAHLKNTNDNILILSDRKSHCFELQRIVYEKTGIEFNCLTGDITNVNIRNRITARIGNGDRALFATGQLIGEGFDCEGLNALFLGCPIAFDGRLLQYIGRVMRPAKGKEQPVIYDYADIKVRPLRNSSGKRIAVYGKENMTYA